MDPAWQYFVDGFFACADAFRQEHGEDPAAVCLPSWALHAMARVPAIHEIMTWPTKALPTPAMVFGLPVIAIGDGFEFYGRTDERAMRWEGRMPATWPWTSVPPEALVGLAEAPAVPSFPIP